MYWYYVVNQQQMGPVPKDEFDRLVSSGTIVDSTLVWSEGMDNWRPYAEIRGGAVAPAAAVPPQPGASPLGTSLSSSSALDGGLSGYTGLGESVGSTGFVDSVVCGSCGRSFARDETIQYGNTSVCASCKPLFFQRLKEGAAVPGTMVYASPWYRFGATLLDGLILSAVNSLMQLGVGQGDVDSMDAGPAVVSFIFQLAVQIAYPTYMVGKYGATIGQMAVKIKTVRSDGSPLTYMRAFARVWAEVVTQLTCLIGYLIAFFDDERRTLHDRMCDTRVVMK